MPGKMQLLTLTLSALLMQTTEASKCGGMTMTKCTDDQCSQNCVSTELQPQDCGISFLGDAVSSGYSSARCDSYKLTYKFYSADNCVGDESEVSHSYYYEQCTITDTGSVKIVPSGEQPEFSELTESEYEERFNQRWNITS